MERRDINLLRARRVESIPEQSKGKTKLWFFLIPGLILAVIFLALSAFSSQAVTRWPQSGLAYDPITLQPKNTGFLSAVKNFFFPSQNILTGQKEDRINILLMGIGGPGHDGPYLSDTNMIVSLRPSQNEVAMVSVPRDLAAKMDEYGWGKINHANAYGESKTPGKGGDFARKIFEETLGVKISYYIRVDFKAFTELIDTVGGVDIDVPRPFVDYSYPGPNYSYQTIFFKGGRQHMDGETALKYARSRHGNNGEGSDFARARRQQLVISALKEKMLSAGTYLNPVTIQKILDSLSSHVTTNLDFGQIMYLAGLSRNVDSDNVKTLVLDSGPEGYLKNIIGTDGAYLLAPRSGNFDEIKFAIDNIFDPTASTTARILDTTPQADQVMFPTAKVELQNGTWETGLAARKKRDLEERGFFISDIGNSAHKPVSSTLVYVINTELDDGFVNALGREFATNPTTTPPLWFTSPTGTIISVGATTSTAKHQEETDVLIILGADQK